MRSDNVLSPKGGSELKSNNSALCKAGDEHTPQKCALKSKNPWAYDFMNRLPIIVCTGLAWFALGVVEAEKQIRTI